MLVQYKDPTYLAQVGLKTVAANAGLGVKLAEIKAQGAMNEDRDARKASYAKDLESFKADAKRGQVTKMFASSNPGESRGLYRQWRRQDLRQETAGRQGWQAAARHQQAPAARRMEKIPTEQVAGMQASGQIKEVNPGTGATDWVWGKPGGG